MPSYCVLNPATGKSLMIDGPTQFNTGGADLPAALGQGWKVDHEIVVGSYVVVVLKPPSSA